MTRLNFQKRTAKHTFMQLRAGGPDFLEQVLGQSFVTVIVPFHDCVIFVRLLNCADFSG
jgi:hypothetical protein